MDRILQTHRFGPHRVDVVEQADDEETTYLVLVDDIIVTETPLPALPRFDDVVRIYAHSQAQAFDATPLEAAEAIGVAVLMNGSPATVYGARAFNASREFHEQRAELDGAA